MRAWDVGVVVTFTEIGIAEDTLRAWHDKFLGTSTSQAYKGKKEFKVATTGAEELLTWEVLRTDLCITAYLEARLVYCYVGVVVTFIAITGEKETVLTERLGKKELWALYGEHWQHTH